MFETYRPEIEKGELTGGREGFIYLIHFSKPIYHARHYLGFAIDLERRLKVHKTDRGAALLRAARERGIKLTIVRVWSGDGNYERKLKRLKNSPCLCPICKKAR